jgi:hypothetical protein
MTWSSTKHERSIYIVPDSQHGRYPTSYLRTSTGIGRVTHWHRSKHHLEQLNYAIDMMTNRIVHLCCLNKLSLLCYLLFDTCWSRIGYLLTAAVRVVWAPGCYGGVWIQLGPAACFSCRSVRLAQSNRAVSFGVHTTLLCCLHPSSRF